MADGSAPANEVEAGGLLRGRGASGGRSLGEILRPLLLVVGPIVILAFIAFLYFSGGRYVQTDNAYVKAPVVNLSTDVSGIVKEIAVVDNQTVQAGQVLFRLDDAPFRYALERAESDLRTARDMVEQQKRTWHLRQDEVQEADVEVGFAQRELTRRKNLFAQHVVPQSAMDQAQQAYDAANRKRESAQQAVSVAAALLGDQPDRAVEEYASVRAAQARVDAAQRDLAQTVVHAPTAGIVTNVPSLQVGEYLAAATPAFGLVSSTDVWIEASPKETELTWVKPGQKVQVTCDTYPGVTWAGHVASIAPASASQFSILPAQNMSGNWVKVVQRITLRVALDPAPDKPVLRAGMSAEISIDTERHRTLTDFGHLFGL